MTSHSYRRPASHAKRDSIPFKEIDAAALAIAESLLKSWFPDGRREGHEFCARNPKRADKSPGSFKFNLRTGVWTDFATGEKGGAGLIAMRAWLDGSSQSEAARRVAAQTGFCLPERPDAGDAAGLTLEAYAAAKKLPAAFLEKLGLKTAGVKRPVLKIPYFNADGSLFRWRLRYAMAGPKKIGWDKDSKAGVCLYGLNMLPAWGCPLFLVEGESDCHTLWYHDYDAVGAPGSKTYNPARDDQYLEGYSIFVLQEPGEGGEAFLTRLSLSRHRSAIRVAKLNGYKDPSDVHLDPAADFNVVMEAAIASAEPLDTVLARLPRLDAKRFTSAVLDDEEEDGKEGPATVLIRLAVRAAVLFKSPDDQTYASVEHDGHRETYALSSKAFKGWLVHRYFQKRRLAPGADALTQALLTLDAMARFEGAEQPVCIRTALHEGKIYIDLGCREWKAAEVSAEGWRVIPEPPVRFIRPAGFRPLPEPEAGGSIDELRRFINVAQEDDFKLLTAWLLAALYPKGPYAVLMLAGQPGAAKTTAARAMRALVDPAHVPLRSPPRDARDLFIAAANAAVIGFDNVSAIPGWLSDDMCTLATGGGAGTRKLHTDNEEMLFNVMRPQIITAVGNVINRSDLANRTIHIHLSGIPDDKRRSDAEFQRAFEQARPRIFGALLTGLARGLAGRDSIALERLPRMADFIAWTRACETAFWEAGAIQAAFERNADDAVNGILEGDSVAVALMAFLGEQPGKRWMGCMGALLAHLNTLAFPGARRERGWPRTPRMLSNRLTMALEPLRRRGISVFSERWRERGKDYFSIEWE